MLLTKAIVRELEKLKIRDIKVYDTEGKSILADAFVVGTADSIVQLEAVRNKLIDYMDERKTALKNPLEEWHGGWSLLDFGDIVVHTFLEELRSFYDIDSLLEAESSLADKIKELKLTGTPANDFQQAKTLKNSKKERTAIIK